MIHIDCTTSSLCPTAHTRQTPEYSTAALFEDFSHFGFISVFFAFLPRGILPTGNLKVHDATTVLQLPMQTWAHQGVRGEGPRYRLYSWVSVDG